jgi:hypothetical protein
MLMIPPHQPVVMGQAAAVSPPFEEVAVGKALEREAAFGDSDLHGARIEDAHDSLIALEVAAEHGERIVVAGLLDPLYIVVV